MNTLSEKKDDLSSIESDLITNKSNEKSYYSDLNEAEKRIAFQLMLDKTKYNCLEQAFEWFDMDEEKFLKMHSQFKDELKQSDVRTVTKKKPYVTTLILLYTGIYKYSEEERGGLWNYFFGLDFDYSYQRDVSPVMDCLMSLSNKYNVINIEREYFQKNNISKIFSQIYIPEISILKIYSAFYSYYHKNNRSGMLTDVIEFLAYNEYRIDKPGLFFLKEDILIENSFVKMLDLFEAEIDDTTAKQDYSLPKRFITALESWKKTERRNLDNQKVEYFIDKPMVICDVLNKSIFLNFPKQKNRKYSDEDCGWKVTIDDERFNIEGRVVREKSGAYVLLNERWNLDDFNSASVKYFYNNKEIRTWQFEKSKSFILFDQDGLFIKENKINRKGAILGLKNTELSEKNLIEEEFSIDGWPNYTFYRLNLKCFNGKKIKINENDFIDIDNNPIFERLDYNYLFEQQDLRNFVESEKVYKNYGSLLIRVPNFDMDLLQITLSSVTKSSIHGEYIKFQKISSTSGKVHINNDLPSDIYNIYIKYNNKEVYKDLFIIDKETIVRNNYTLGYNTIEGRVNQYIEVEPSNDVSFETNSMDTKVSVYQEKISITNSHEPIVKFLYKRNKTVAVEKILFPYKLQVHGLEEFFDDTKLNNQYIEITNEVFLTQDLQLELKNLDYRFSELTYEICFIDTINDLKILESKKVKFYDSISWRLGFYYDRLIEFQQFDVSVRILKNENDLLAEIPIFKIEENIQMLKFKLNEDDNHLIMEWSEKRSYKNKEMIIRNIGNLMERPIVIPLKDTERSVKLDKSMLSYGFFLPQLRFVREYLGFEESKIEFDLNRKNKNYFLSKEKGNSTLLNRLLVKLLWDFRKQEYDKFNSTIEKMDFGLDDLPLVYTAILQLKYYVEENLPNFIKLLYTMCQKMHQKFTCEQLLKGLIALESKISLEDFSFILNGLLSSKFDNQIEISSETRDILIEYDIMAAFEIVKNGSGNLSKNMILSLRSTFDQELLSKEMVRDSKRIFDVISKEIDAIAGFWEWLSSHKNRNMLMSGIGKNVLFRTYEQEFDISTYKILGKTIDDMIDAMGSVKSNIVVKLPPNWEDGLGIQREVYEDFLNTINASKEIQYKEVLKAAFVSINKPSFINEGEQFEIFMNCYLSTNRDVFNRYRALIKLISI